MKDLSEIRNVAEITSKQAKELKKQGVNYISVQDDEDYPEGKLYYPEDIVEIKKAIHDFLLGMPDFDKNDPNYEKKVFSYVYVKLALTVKYDTKAAKIASKPGYALDEEKGEYVNNAASMYGALINRRAICSGLSDALRNILAEMGIRAKYISSKPNEDGERHAWNQVYLDGEWYNCDVTNDAEFFKKGLIAKHFLVSDADFEIMQMYSVKNPALRARAKARSLYPDEQWKFTCGVIKQIKAELKELNKRPKFVEDISAKVAENNRQRGN